MCSAVGNKAFAECFEKCTDYKKCFRLVYQGDFIVGVPKFYKLFKHTGVEVELWLDHRGQCQAICDPSPLERSLLTTWKSNLGSHGLAAYEGELTELVKKFCGDKAIEVLAQHEMHQQELTPREPESGDHFCRECGKPTDNHMDEQGGSECCCPCWGAKKGGPLCESCQIAISKRLSAFESTRDSNPIVRTLQ